MLERHLVLPIEPEVALNGEGCLLDFGLGYDLGRTLGLALDPLRDWGISACRFAYRAVVFPLAVGSYGARHALVFQLAVRAGLACRAAVFQSAVGARFALRAAAFQITVAKRVKLLAPGFDPSVRARVTSRHYSPLRTCVCALRATTGEDGVVAFGFVGSHKKVPFCFSFVVLALRRTFKAQQRNVRYIIPLATCSSLAVGEGFETIRVAPLAETSLDCLPVDVLFLVTKTLGGNDLLACAAVSTAWRDALEPVFEERCGTYLHKIDSKGTFLDLDSVNSRDLYLLQPFVDLSTKEPVQLTRSYAQIKKAPDESRRAFFSRLFCRRCRKKLVAHVAFIFEAQNSRRTRPEYCVAEGYLCADIPTLSYRAAACNSCLATTEAMRLLRGATSINLLFERPIKPVVQAFTEW